MESDIESLLVYNYNALKYQQRNVCKLLFLKGDENDGGDEDDDEDGVRK